MKIIVIKYCLIGILCLCAVCAFGQFETKHINKEHICWDKNNPDSARFFLVNSLPYKMGVIKDQQTNFLGVVDSTGNIQIPFAAYDTLIPMEVAKKEGSVDIYFLFKNKNSPKKMGSMDNKGNILLPNTYDYKDDYYGHTYAKTQILTIHENKKKIINTLTCKVDFEVDRYAFVNITAWDSSRYYWIIEKNGKQNAVSSEGIVLSDTFIYKRISWLNDYKYIEVDFEGKIGVYDTKFKQIAAPKYYWVSGFKNGLMAAKLQNGDMHILDSLGNVLHVLHYEYINKIDNFYIFIQNEHCGLLDKNFQIICPAIYEYSSFEIYHNGHFIVERDSLKGLVDTLGREVLVPMFKYIDVNFDGFKLQMGDDMHGYFLPLKNIFIPAIYDNFYCIQQNYYVAQKDGFTGLLDNNLNEIIPFIYEEIKPLRCSEYNSEKKDYQDTLMCYKFPNQTFFIHNLKNDSLYFTPYDFIGAIDQELIEVNIYLKGYEFKILEGCIDLNMQEVIPCKYDFITIEEHFVKVYKNGKYGLLDKKGNEILPCKYAELKTPINYYDPKFEIKVKKTDDSKWEIYNVDTKTFRPDKK